MVLVIFLSLMEIVDIGISHHSYFRCLEIFMLIAALKLWVIIALATRYYLHSNKKACYITVTQIYSF